MNTDLRGSRDLRCTEACIIRFALHCTALHCTALYCVHCIGISCTTLHCSVLHCTALHCTALMHTALSAVLSVLYSIHRTAHCIPYITHCTLLLHTTNCTLLKLHTAKKALHTHDAIQQGKCLTLLMRCPTPGTGELSLKCSPWNSGSLLSQHSAYQHSYSQHSQSQHLIPKSFFGRH